MTTRDWGDGILIRLREEADPLADQVVAAYFADQHLDEPGALMADMVRHARLPPEEQDPAVAAYLRDEPARPDWADEDLISQGQELFAQHGVHIFAVLFGASLPTAYAGHKGVQALGLTARLATDTQRRIVETAQFHLDVMRSEGLEPGGVGIRTTRHVRLMHAAIRWLIAHDPRVHQGPAPEDEPHWDPAWGVPICQSDLLYTLLTFTQVIFEVFDKSGVELSEPEREAYLHTFCVVGSYLGIRDDLLPLDLDDARIVLTWMHEHELAHSAAGVEMSDALLDLSASAMHWPFKGLPVSSLRFFLGDRIAEMLDVPPADWTRHLYGPMAAVSRRFGGRVHAGWLKRFNRRLGYGMLDTAVNAARGGNRPDFAIPTHLAERWSIKQ